MWQERAFICAVQSEYVNSPVIVMCSATLGKYFLVPRNNTATYFCVSLGKQSVTLCNFPLCRPKGDKYSAKHPVNVLVVMWICVDMMHSGYSGIKPGALCLLKSGALCWDSTIKAVLLKYY